jgi:hypothetical protein
MGHQVCGMSTSMKDGGRLFPSPQWMFSWTVIRLKWQTFWTLSIVYPWLKTHDISETGVCLRHQAKKDTYSVGPNRQS